MCGSLRWQLKHNQQQPAPMGRITPDTGSPAGTPGTGMGSVHTPQLLRVPALPSAASHMQQATQQMHTHEAGVGHAEQLHHTMKFFSVRILTHP
jgi:hypothetical protein